jgi:hypothetical protein
MLVETISAIKSSILSIKKDCCVGSGDRLIRIRLLVLYLLSYSLLNCLFSAITNKA